jgi:hypothetical protein
MKRILLLVLCALTCGAQELRVYAIDVEGGKATLYVSPSGQSMLVDAGTPASPIETPTGLSPRPKLRALPGSITW